MKEFVTQRHGGPEGKKLNKTPLKPSFVALSALSEAKATPKLGDGDRRGASKLAPGEAEGERHPQVYSLYAEDGRDPEAKPKRGRSSDRRDPSPSTLGA